MKRLLMFVGVAVVAAAMYVAASPASQQSKGPTAKQFASLKKQVSTMSKELKTVKAEADFSASYLLSCLITVNTDNSLSVNLLPAVVTTTGSPVVYQTTSPSDLLQEINPSCISGSALKHGVLRLNGSGLRHWVAKNTR